MGWRAMRIYLVEDDRDAGGADGVVEGEGLAKKVRLACAQVEVLVQLADARRNLADFPSTQARCCEGLSLVLLERPQLGERLESLVEMSVPVVAAIWG